MEETFSCQACGGPNKAIPGAKQMPCAYCGANLTIPDSLRVEAKPRAKIKPPQEQPAPRLEKEAPDLLRKAQPVAIKAWNAFALWTWIRKLIPACLVIVVIGLIACAALGALPFVWAWSR